MQSLNLGKFAELSKRDRRPEGPLLNNPVRERGADQLANEGERRRCAQRRAIEGWNGGPSGLRPMTFRPSTPSRTWLLNIGPSGL
ncbi:MAG TPA: hypothetical protein VN920_12460, partial [Pyrinomonadaceae bacterium]|nr:hypothetical protein [Pyrinomonadaceae bacterium]